MHFDCYARVAETFLRSSIDNRTLDKLRRRNRTGTQRVNVHLQVCFQYARISETRRTMQRSHEPCYRDPVTKNESAFTFIEFQRRSFLRSFCIPRYRESVQSDFAKPRPRCCNIVAHIVDERTKCTAGCPKTTECPFSTIDSLTNSRSSPKH